MAFLDRREGILSRLHEILGEIEGVETVLRNQRLTDVHATPAIQLMDAGERANENDRPETKRAFPPRRVAMTPEIYVTLGPVAPADVGPNVSAMRMAIVHAIGTDSELLELVGSNGSIVYDGDDTDLSLTSTLKGQMSLQFTFNYFLRPDELAPESA